MSELAQTEDSSKSPPPRWAKDVEPEFVGRRHDTEGPPTRESRHKLH